MSASVTNARATTFTVMGESLIVEEVRRSRNHGTACTIFDVVVARHDLATHVVGRSRVLYVVARMIRPASGNPHINIEQMLWLREDWYGDRFGLVTADAEWLSEWFGLARVPRKRDRTQLMANFRLELATRLEIEDGLE